MSPIVGPPPGGGGGGGGGYTYTGDGSPVGVQDAAAIGNTYLDSTNGASYFATATGTDGWVLVSGNGQGPTDTGVLSTPGSAALQDGTGGYIGVGPNVNIQPGSSGDQVRLASFAGAGVTVDDDGAGNTLIGLYSLSGVPQAAAPTLVATTTPALASYGFTQAQAMALIAAVNALIVAVSAGNGGIGITA